MKTIITLISIALLSISCKKEETTTTAADPVVDEATGNVTAKPYPLDVCLVSGEKLGSMGEPIIIVHNGQEIKFCCEECVPKFKADPEKYLGKLDQ